ncbi:MAG TPA: OmpH family outer membrane protein, partial [Salinimicrobium sp.]|nr:OmpH family outer membrane protein [Salinimicrobium sp.]
KLLVLLVLGSALVGCEKQKTAYVDTTALIQEYSEMKEIKEKFTAKSELVKKQLDSMATLFQEEVKTFQAEMESMSQTERQEAQAQLMQKQQMLRQMQQAQATQLRTASDAAIDSVITKVKDFVADYGKEHNYTYIFGSNESANIMYAKEGLDITDKILKELNAAEPAE